jgi:hypothetical protein
MNTIDAGAGDSNAQEATGTRDGHVVAALLREEPHVALRVATHHTEHDHL